MGKRVSRGEKQKRISRVKSKSSAESFACDCISPHEPILADIQKSHVRGLPLLGLV